MDEGQSQRGEVFDDVLEQRLGVGVHHVVGGGHGRDADASASAAHGVGHGTGHFQHQPGAVGDGAAVVVGALVAAALGELVEQVAVGAVDFHAVKAGGGDGVAGGGGVVVHDAGQLGHIQRAGHRRFGEHGRAFVQQHGLGLGGDGRRTHWRQAPGLQRGVRHTAHMPELHHDLAAGLVHSMGHLLPAVELLGAVQARHVGITLGLVGDGRAFAHDQAGAGALGVVLHGEVVGDGVGRAVARERRHDDAVGQLQVASGGGVEQRGHGSFRGNAPGR